MDAPSAKPTKPLSDSDKRYFRYKRIIDWAVNQSEFELDDAKSAVDDERPVFVTRVVRDLEASGFIVRQDRDSSVYRWNPGKSFSATKWLDEKLFGTQIKESPEQDRPRERLLANGAERLTNGELIAILIRSGRPGESAVMGGQKVARAFQHRLEDLPAAGRAELKAISCAVEKTAYCQIMAGIELGRRVGALSDSKVTQRIGSSGEAIAFVQRHFARLASDRKQEEFHIVTLNTKNQVIDTHQITVGTLDASLVHPREVFRPAIRDAASSVILVHNHPSGDPTPSREDFAVTRRLTEVGKVIGINVLDHIVLGNPESISIREAE
ncbi:MAG: DNA repair protein RadC [Planctomycetota bacterium]